jgi:hypothetical protein
MIDFGELHYKGDKTQNEAVQPGKLFGRDETFRLMEVIDTEYDPTTDRTTVHLQWARPETLRAHQASIESQGSLTS